MGGIRMGVCDGIGRHARFRFSCGDACGFKSRQTHQKQKPRNINGCVVFFAFAMGLAMLNNKNSFHPPNDFFTEIEKNEPFLHTHLHTGKEGVCPTWTHPLFSLLRNAVVIPLQLIRLGVLVIQKRLRHVRIPRR